MQVWAIAGGLTGGAACAAAGVIAAGTVANRALAARARTIDFDFADIALNKPFETRPRPLDCRGRGRTERLLLVADPVDGARLVVGDQQGAVRRLKDIVGTAEDLLVVEPGAGKDGLLGVLAVGVDRDKDDPVAELLVPVPRTMLGDEHAVLVLGRELIAGIELHAERRDVRAEL